jgi:hypothetical protein
MGHVKPVAPENRAKVAIEYGANLSNWMILDNDRSNITGKLPEWDPEPKKNAAGLTKTGQRYKNKFDGKHNPRCETGNKRKSTNPRELICDSCGKPNADKIFNGGKYERMRCIPMDGDHASVSKGSAPG